MLKRPVILDRPNVFLASEERRWRDSCGRAHRWGGPAKEFSSGVKHWYWHGKFVHTDFGGRGPWEAGGAWSKQFLSMGYSWAIVDTDVP